MSGRGVPMEVDDDQIDDLIPMDVDDVQIDDLIARMSQVQLDDTTLSTRTTNSPTEGCPLQPMDVDDDQIDDPLQVDPGKAATQKVQRKIDSKDALIQLFKYHDPKGECSITSCNVTAQILGETISNEPLEPVQGLFPMTESAKVDEIDKLLNSRSPKMVAIQLSPDHHFIVFPTDTDKVVILQGFQDAYNLYEWMQESNNVMNKDAFVTAMKDLGSKDPKEKQTAAVKLFSYGDATLDQEIRKYYTEKSQIQIKSISSKNL
jgi:hypothetical protein